MIDDHYFCFFYATWLIFSFKFFTTMIILILFSSPIKCPLLMISTLGDVFPLFFFSSLQRQNLRNKLAKILRGLEHLQHTIKFSNLRFLALQQVFFCHNLYYKSWESNKAYNQSRRSRSQARRWDDNKKHYKTLKDRAFKGRVKLSSIKSPMKKLHLFP